MEIERVGVIGGGLMGSGIAEVCARVGSDVVVHEINPETAEAALGRINKSLDRAVERGKLDDASKSEILGRIAVSTELSEQADRQLVIEAATENENLKKKLFSALDEVGMSLVRFTVKVPSGFWIGSSVGVKSPAGSQFIKSVDFSTR